MSSARPGAHALCIILAAAIAVPAWGSPADLTAPPAPTIGADPPKAHEIKDGDASVSTQTGALQYAYPIAVPPGRGGAQPSLALSYSSQGAVYGGIASGWSLSVPEIQLDPSVSVMKQLLRPDDWSQQRFVSSLSGGRPLVAVTEPAEGTVEQTFRAQNDSSYVRYERMRTGQPYLWRARSPDGTTYYFGDTTRSAGWSQPLRVPLTRTVDTFGNTVEYQWSGTQLDQIRYTSNPAAGLPAFARIELEYIEEGCGTRLPTGAAEDLRLASVDGRGKLTRIRAIAFDPASGAIQHTRQYTLGYDAQAGDCYGVHAPLRILTSIQESAWGPSAPRVDLPPVTFDYNRLARTFEHTSYQPWPSGAMPASSSAGLRSQGGWPTVTSMLLDFDGDALVDRIALVPDANECAFTWEKNLGRGPDGVIRFDAPSAPQLMPRLPWGAGPRSASERCSLNYQATLFQNVADDNAPGCRRNTGVNLAYRWMDLTGDGKVDLVAAIHYGHHLRPNAVTDPAFFASLRIAPWGACSDAIETPPAPCPALAGTCMQDAVVCDGKDACGFSYKGALRCLEAAKPRVCEVMTRTMDQFGQHDPDQNTLGPDWPEGTQPPGQDCSRKRPHERCGRNPWFLYANTGGALAPTGVVKYQPIPLESDTGDSAIGGFSGFASQQHAIQDMDGDGNLDAVVRGISVDDAAADWWFVYRGDGRGGFLSDDAGHPYTWRVHQQARLSGGCTQPLLPGHSCAVPGYGDVDYDTLGEMLLVDLNGDGATDYSWRNPEGLGTDDAQAFYGNGRAFGSWVDSSAAQGQSVGSGIDFLSRGHAHASAQALNTGWLKSGWRQSRTRLVDVDADGRVDLVRSVPDKYPRWTPPNLHMNAGGDFLPGTRLPATSYYEQALIQHTTAESDDVESRWATQRDLIDMDGDGLPEHWNFLAGQGGEVATYHDRTDQPLRLLRAIDNGLGGRVEITYAASTNAEVVTQDAALGKAMPRSQWVVRELSVHDRWDPDVATTSYAYRYPVWKRDERGRWGFRGFEEVTTTRPSGARAVDTYGFDVDWSGRLVASRSFAAEDLTGPLTIGETTWQAFTLFGGALTTYHRTADRSWTCRPGEPEAACRAAAVGFVKHAATWTAQTSALGASGPALLYVEESLATQRGEAYAVGDRRTTRAFRLHADADAYRLWEEDVRSDEETAQGATPYRRVQTFYDAAYRAPTSQRQWLHGDWTRTAEQPVTTWDLDWTTGVKRGSQSPNNHLSGLFEIYEYDPTRRFVVRTVNELGHAVDRAYDPGTGAVLSVRGPMRPGCDAACNASQSWTDVDGLGRTRATWVNVEVPGSSTWQKTRTSNVVYTDRVLGGQPTSVVSESRIEYGADRWTHERTRLDGQARPREVRVTTGLGADAVTTYDYDHRGHLVAVSLPDPSVSDPATTPTPTVTYRYGFDSLGRPTSVRRPAMGGDASGVDLTYDGLVHRVTELAGGEGGPAGHKILVHDAFGRLVNVLERIGGGGIPYAKTTYQYDPRDTVTRIQNAEGVVTELRHDFAGRRVGITRAGRTWTYGYDRSGNLVAEAAPPPIPALAAAYTTTHAYDVTGRPRSRSVGSRELSSSDQALFGVGTTVFGHDDCPGGLGRLCSVRLPESVLDVAYAYDAEGNPTRESRSFKIAGVHGELATSVTYGPGGRIREQTYADAGPAGSDRAGATGSRIDYDDRGLPSQLWWLPAGKSPRLVARQTRNLAGLVTRRTAATVDPAIPELESVFTYDRLTRVQSQTVIDLPSTQLAKQQLEYYGQDDPARLEHWLGSEHYDLNFTYDLRHQLTAVKEARFEAHYGFTPAGKLGRVTVRSVAAPGADVVDRDVWYKYGSPVDPEAVSALAPVAGGAPLRSYTYDTAGNLATRDGGPAPETFAYDGEDQLRRATVGTAREEYFYDHAGQRMAVVTRGSAGAVDHVRVFFGDTELVLSATSDLKQAKAHLSLGTPVGRVTDRANLELQYHGLASNTLLTVTPDGTVQAGFVYAPYGEVLLATGTSAKAEHRRFNDKFRDDLTALTYYGARYYDGLSLTWTQANPLYRFAPDAAWDEPRRGLLYVFSRNNPVRYIDPDGRQDTDSLFFANQLPGYDSRGNPNPPPTADEAFVALVAIVSVVNPAAGFMLAMSRAETHNDTVLPIVALGCSGALPRSVEPSPQAAAPGSAAAAGGAEGGASIKAVATEELTTVTGGAGKEGIYEFPDQAAGGVPYVGQSVDVSRRLAEHTRAGRLNPGTETTCPVAGGKTAREIAEHQRIQELTGGVPARESPVVSNKVDPIGPKRSHLLE